MQLLQCFAKLFFVAMRLPKCSKHVTMFLIETWNRIKAKYKFFISQFMLQLFFFLFSFNCHNKNAICDYILYICDYRLYLKFKLVFLYLQL